MVKLLLDENLSPRVASDLRGEGQDVVHLRERGRLGVADHEVLRLAFDEDRVLVTANVGDFRKLAGARTEQGRGHTSTMRDARELVQVGVTGRLRWADLFWHEP